MLQKVQLLEKPLYNIGSTLIIEKKYDYRLFRRVFLIKANQIPFMELKKFKGA